MSKKYIVEIEKLEDGNFVGKISEEIDEKMIRVITLKSVMEIGLVEMACKI